MVLSGHLALSDKLTMRWLKKAYRDPVWFLVSLPFKLVYLLLCWIFSGNGYTKGEYVLRKSKAGRVRYEHREIAEEILGRPLEHWEVVHHINGRRDDNRPSNLCVMSRRNHDRYHKWYDWVRTTHGKYPRRSTQLRKLKESFNGTLLEDFKSKSTEAG